MRSYVYLPHASNSRALIMRRSGSCCPPCGCLSKRHSCILLAFLSITSVLFSYILLEFKNGTKQPASKTTFHEGKSPSWIARRFDEATERADEGIQERKRKYILEEFQELARIVNSTVEEFGLRLLRRWALLEAQFCSSLLSSAGTGFELFASDACKETCTDIPGGKKRIALIIPIRDRWEHLHLLFRSLVPLLRSQNLCFLIVLAEQAPGQPFNKGLLMNAGVIEALNFMPFHCVAFHDVDLIPISTNLSYACPSYPRHLSTQIDKFNFSLPYVGLVGGVLAVPLDQFLRVNGFSNMFWGWGAEDDDFFERLMFIGLPVIRPHPGQAKYVMLQHNKSKATDSWRRSALLALSFKRYRLDGLNTLIYSLKKKTLTPLGNYMPTDRQAWTDFGTDPVLHLLIEVTRRSPKEPHGL